MRGEAATSRLCPVLDGNLAFRVVRTPTHKLILWKDPARQDELYDLVADPQEAHHL
jgi:hypothetical protein